MWDIEPQLATCDNSQGDSSGVFGACCMKDNDCSSGVCDASEYVCTFVCRDSEECPAPQIGVAPHCILPQNAPHNAATPLRKTCLATQMTPQNISFCRVFCMEKALESSAYEMILQNAPNVSGKICWDSVRKFCTLHRFLERACHTPEAREAMGLTGSKTLFRHELNTTIDRFVMGQRYFGKIYAKNELGAGWPTYTMPAFEIPRAAAAPALTM